MIGKKHSTLYTFYLWLYGIRHMVKTTQIVRGRKEMFYLTTHSTHFIYGYMASDIWLRTILIVRKETRYRHMGYSFRLTARVLLYAPFHRQDSTYHCLCYMELWLKWEIAQWVHHEGSIWWPIAPWFDYSHLARMDKKHSD